MPQVRASLIDKLLAVFDPARGRAGGDPGDRAAKARQSGGLVHGASFPELMALDGDVGARNMIRALFPRAVAEVPFADSAALGRCRHAGSPGRGEGRARTRLISSGALRGPLFLDHRAWIYDGKRARAFGGCRFWMHLPDFISVFRRLILN